MCVSIATFGLIAFSSISDAVAGCCEKQRITCAWQQHPPELSKGCYGMTSQMGYCTTSEKECGSIPVPYRCTQNETKEACERAGQHFTYSPWKPTGQCNGFGECVGIAEASSDQGGF